MLRVVKWIMAVALFSAPVASVFAQAAVQTFTDDYSYRELNAGVDGSPTPIATGASRFLYHYHQETGWDDSQFKEGNYRGSATPLASGGSVSEFMNWRILYPTGYDPSGATKYPMIIMLHGAGEGGRLWSGSFSFTPADVDYDNNGKNIVWGGQPHQDAVNRTAPDPRAFPGIVIWPQASYNGAWESGWQNGAQNQNSIIVSRIIEHFIAVKNVDPDRIYMHGLSNGAAGTWDLASKRPDLFAAILPMSGTPSNVAAQTDALVTTPIWLFQGGQDTNPNPQASATVVSTMQTKGGSLRYTLYPPLGHDTWESAYAEPDFFTWILSKNKKDIYVFGGEAAICPGGTLKLGFSANMIDYEWFLNGVSQGVKSSANRFFNATQVGTYTVKFTRRTDGLTYTSNPLNVIVKTASTFHPVITNTGSLYETIDQSGATNPVVITAPLGYSSYTWNKSGALTTTTNNTYTVNGGNAGAAADAGNYSVSVKESTGCQSLSSNTITVVYNSPQPTSPRPTAPTPVATTPTSFTVTWPDYASTEIGYELWRFRFSNTAPAYAFESWALVTVLPTNTTSYVDKTTRPSGAQYRYAIRAILPDGHAIFSPESNSAVATTDVTPPTVPTNFLASNVTDSKVTLSWSAPLDNDLVYKYEIYNGSSLLTTITGSNEAKTAPLTTTTITTLIPGTTYVLSVRAIDYTGNPSAFADPVSITTLASLPGLLFKYWTFAGNIPGADGAYIPEPQLSTSFDFTQTPAQTGSVATFDISGANVFQNTGDPNQFVYSFDGYIQIPSAGHYIFYTASDDGSRLYINGSLLVMNDHLQGTTDRGNNTPDGSAIALTAGRVPIHVTYFEQGGGNVLTVSWQKTDGADAFAETPIPASVLYQSAVSITNFYLATGAADPSLLASWTSNADGSAGTAPLDFTTTLQNFTLKNTSSIDISNPWTVSGAGSKVIAGDGVNPITVNVSAAYTGTMDGAANAVINVTTTTMPAFGTLDATSTVNFNVAAGGTLNVPNATYGNVNFMTAKTYVLPINATTVQGSLVVADGATTQGSTVNVSMLRVGGDLTFNNVNSPTNPLPGALGSTTYSLAFVGGVTHNVTFAKPINPVFSSLQTDINDDVIFNNSTGRTYTFGSSLGGGLTLKAGSTLDVGNGNVTISGLGTINSNSETGSLAMNGGNFVYSSTSAQNSNVTFSPTTNLINNFTMSAGVPSTSAVNILSTVNIKNTVTLNNGKLNPGTGAFLTLLSDSTGINARIAALGANARITGKVTAQRFMPGKTSKVYRYISSPVKQATAAMLQESFLITGAFTGADVIPGINSSASMYWYNSTQTYVPFPATGSTNADTMKTGEGYTAYMRKTSGGITWTVQGVPNQGTISFSALMATGTSAANGWSLLGNPYASQIAWTGFTGTGGWTMTNVNPTVYVRDNASSSSYTWRVYRTGISTVGANEAAFDGKIAAGQGFWVQASGTPTLTISEAAKTTGAAVFYRSDSVSTEPSYDVMTVGLSDGKTTDVAYIAHDEKVLDSYEPLQDAVKQANTGFNISSLSSDNIELVINMTPSAFCEKEIRLKVAAPAGSYTLNFDGIDKYKNPVSAILKDRFLDKTVEITAGAQYAFAVTSDVASAGSDRFVITEKPVVYTSLPMLATNACESNPAITIIGAQAGVTYQASLDGMFVSDSVRASGDTLKLILNKKALGFGVHSVNVAASLRACGAVTMGQNVFVTIDTLTTPLVKYASGYLVAVPADADSYQWMLDGRVIKGETKSSIRESDAGSYQVQVRSGECTKLSSVFALTGFQEANATVATVYPNPFFDKLTLSLPVPVAEGAATLYNVLGQPVQSTTFSTSDSQQADLKFYNLEAGTYILSVGIYKLKVVKVNSH